MAIDDLISLLTCIFTAIFGAGGLCAFIITLVKLNKRTKTYEIRCRMAAEMIKSGIVNVSPEAAKDLLLKVLEDKFDETNRSFVNKVIRTGKANLKKGVK